MANRIINCTPHPLAIVDKDNEVVRFPKGEIVPRVSTKIRVACEVCDFDVSVIEFGGVIDLPPVVEGTVYIVSAMVANAATDRYDLLSPGELIRDKEGRVIGAKGLITPNK